jgi:hypothetical protein
MREALCIWIFNSVTTPYPINIYVTFSSSIIGQFGPILETTPKNNAISFMLRIVISMT